jgi:hypothetical protein
VGKVATAKHSKLLALTVSSCHGQHCPWLLVAVMENGKNGQNDAMLSAGFESE